MFNGQSAARLIQSIRVKSTLNMDANENITNSHSILSLVLGILTIVAFCMGSFPIPFTGFICFPASFFLGILALIFGIISLNQIRRRNESGSPMAWVGVAVGGFVFICVICAVISFALMFIFAPDYIPAPPYFGGYQL
ncbi:MAG: DUF4190 domain-containing protein [Anaerolineales bacterium]|nr:DUF4190 domain-containing protein [Anaerolineales bacterium]